MTLKYPRGWYLYSLLFGVSSLLVFLGLHRVLFGLLRSWDITGAAVPVLTGLTNLSWYEMAFVIGGFAKSVNLFSALPLIGALLGCASAVLLHMRFRYKSALIRAHLFFGVAISAAGLAIVLLRTVRGYEDQWRLICACATLALYAGWAYYFFKTRGLFASLEGGK